MAFLDDVTKKLGEASETVVRKGKELSEITKLRFSLCEEQKKADELYRKIGKLYVSHLGDEIDDEYLIFVSEVKGLEARIRNLKQQINELKGVSFCSSCGKKLSDGATYCQSCGKKID